VEPMTGRGDKNIKKIKVKKSKREAGKSWDGVSRPSTDDYRENWVRIFDKKE